VESGVSKEKCDHYVQFVMEKLYNLDNKIIVVQTREQVTIYTKPGCPFYAAAKQDLEERGIPYIELSIQDDPKVVRGDNASFRRHRYSSYFGNW